MSTPDIRLKIKHRFPPSEIRIYRATAPIDFSSLPTPIATLTEPVDEYRDEGPLSLGTTYHYAIAVDNSESPAQTLFATGQITTTAAASGVPISDQPDIFHSTTYVVVRLRPEPKVFHSTTYVVVAPV